MISFLRGIVAEKRAGAVALDCNGVGYEVLTPLTVSEGMPPVGEEATLLVEFVVREDSQTLYGFASHKERRVFRRLLKVSGIGAKTALAMLSAISLQDLLAALQSEDAARLSSVPGIGAKTADRLIVDFRGSDLLTGERAQWSADEETAQALQALGYNKAEVRKVLAKLTAADGDTTEQRVRAALRILSAKK